jgi:hypothetical protein
MKRARTFMIVFIVETIGVLMFLGCSSPKNKKSSDAQMDTAVIYEDMSQETSVSKVGIDSSQSTLVSPQKTDATSALDLSINPYYDAGYDQGQEDGYYDGIENIQGDSYDDACRYKGKKRKEYELGYEEGYDYGFADSDCDSEEEE